VTLRDETEWTELVRIGWNTLAPLHDAGTIANTILDVLDRPPPPEPTGDLYGGGVAAKRIAAKLVETADR
jgi:UDP-N-acetylglucosamine 2-epimerase